MRLFIAVDMPEQVTRELAKLQDPNLAVNWSSPDTMHLTLRFVGDVQETSGQEQLIQELTAIDMPPMSLTVNGLGYFPPNRQPKVIWAGIMDHPDLMRLQEQVEQACRSAGLEPDNREYIPHVTLGRVNGLSKKEVHSFFNRSKKVRIEDIPVREFILYESRLHPDGAEHLPYRRFGLTGQRKENEA